LLQHGCYRRMKTKVNRYTPTLIWLLSCIIVCALNWRCASINQNGEAIKRYPLIDTRLRIHKYKHNIQWQFFVKANPRTEYCSAHHQWEDIKPIYRLVNEEMKWVYQVGKNKKQ